MMFVMMIPYRLVVTYELYHSQDKLSRIISYPPTLRTVVVVGAPGFVGYLVKVEGYGEIDDSNRPTNDIDFHVLHGTSAT
jgi:hypothetical protein